MFSKLERKMAYQAIAYFSRIAFLGCAVFMGDFMANLYDKVIEEKCQLAYCMYYFVVFDHGLACMAKQLDELLKCEQADQEGLLLIKDCVRMLVCQSLSMGVESKARWEQTADKCSPEIWKEIAFILRHGQGKRGNRKRIMTLDEMLTGDIRQAKQDIRKFLSENTDDISLAYLLVSLTRAQRIKPSVRYMTFHRAIEQFARRKYGHDIPQKRYGEIKELGLKEPQRGASYTRAKKIVDKWTEIF